MDIFNFYLNLIFIPNDVKNTFSHIDLCIQDSISLNTNLPLYLIIEVPIIVKVKTKFRMPCPSINTKLGSYTKYQLIATLICVLRKDHGSTMNHLDLIIQAIGRFEFVCYNQIESK